MTQQNKLIFAVVMGITLLSSAVFLFLQYQCILPSNSSRCVATTIEVAVPPALLKWAQQAAQDFNAQGQNQVKIRSLKGTEARRQLNLSTAHLPDAWLAEATFARQVAGNIPFPLTGATMAQDWLTWVVKPENADLAAQLNWKTVHDTAKNDGQFNIAIPAANSVECIAACLSAAAEYHGTATLDRNLITDGAFRRWFDELLEAIPDRQKNPRDQLAIGVQVGLLLNSESTALKQQNFMTVPPIYNVVLNYPYFIRTAWPELANNEDIKAHQQVAEDFKNFLLSSTQQAKLGIYGLEQATATPNGQFIEPNEQIVEGLQWCWQ